MKCIVNGKLILKDQVVSDMAVVFDEKIVEITKKENIDKTKYEIIDARGKYVSPGLIDMHIHGYLGADASDGTSEGVQKMAEGIIKNGVTSWCPTTMTVSIEELEKAFDSIRALKESNEYYGSRILGVNAEGPFINPDKKGAQPGEHIKKPDAEFIKKHSDIIKLFTIAPEIEGAMECIEDVRKNTDILISIGHTNATFEEALEGFDRGVGHVTHLFNAMTALSHRNPGVVGAALSRDDITTEFIADTFHIDKGLYSLVGKAKKEKLCLITDCMRAGGMPDGDYTLGGQFLNKTGIKCLLPNGTIAGSVLTLNKAVYNFFTHSNLKLNEVVNCASLNVAKALGTDNEIGSIEVGKRADIMIADEEFNIDMTILGGEIRYKGE
ncbi:MAG: N-acetylglucosamine-6-phosphate deacetylase [Clostridia bacterium]|nr:N-acetylglucosamine-6-phosphate deacetylase [Clostridia bacterium]